MMNVANAAMIMLRRLARLDRMRGRGSSAGGRRPGPGPSITSGGGPGGPPGPAGRPGTTGATGTEAEGAAVPRVAHGGPTGGRAGRGLVGVVAVPGVRIAVGVVAVEVAVVHPSHLAGLGVRSRGHLVVAVSFTTRAVPMSLFATAVLRPGRPATGAPRASLRRSLFATAGLASLAPRASLRRSLFATAGLASLAPRASLGSLAAHSRPRTPTGASGARGAACRQCRPAEQVLLDEVVPTAAPAHLHHIHLELTERHRQHGQLGLAARLARRLPELVAVDVVHVGDVLPAAHRASVVARLAVKLRRADLVRRSVAHLVRADAAGVDLAQHRAAAERVVDHLALRTHGPRVRGQRALGDRRDAASQPFTSRWPAPRFADRRRWLYGYDVSGRYIGLIGRQTGFDGSAREAGASAGTGDSRATARVSDARLRAPQAADH